MTFETKEEVFERVISQENPKCPHCGKEMSLWEVPDINVSDGLGWGTPYLFVCFNDECPLYSQGWKDIQENYGRTASYRCMCYPGAADATAYECMPVWGPQGGHGQILDETVLEERRKLDDRIQKGLAILAECAVKEDRVEVLRILLDAAEPARVRVRAAEMMADMGDTSAIDALRNNRFGNRILVKKVEDAVSKIHARHYTRECPFCAEIIKKRAHVCKHCGKELNN